MIDWTKPIEAYHTDGSVTPVTLQMDDESGMPMQVSPLLRDEFGIAEWFYRDGSRQTGGWRIRNRAEPANDELAELRAFKEAAIARFPELAEPETDEKAAERICKEYDQGVWGTSYEIAIAGIRWARTNPR